MKRRTWLILTVLYLSAAFYLAIGSAVGFQFDKVFDDPDRTVYYTDKDLIAHREDRTDATGGMMAWGAEGYSYSNFPLMIRLLSVLMGFVPLIAIFPGNDKKRRKPSN